MTHHVTSSAVFLRHLRGISEPALGDPERSRGGPDGRTLRLKAFDRRGRGENLAQNAEKTGSCHVAPRFRRPVLVLLLLSTLPALAQRHRDPFTQPEIDQIRDTSWEPQRRLALYVQFARARLTAMEQMRADPKTKNRAQQTHDKLDDFTLIYDELNDNIDTYIDRKDDIRKPLKGILDADAEFDTRLRALKDTAGVPPEEARQYEFVLSTALDTVDSSTEDHRKLLAGQEEAAKHRKKPETKPSSRPE